MKKILGLLLGFLLVAGCATTLTPRQVAVNSLLATQQTVVLLAQEGDNACKMGILNHVQCMQLKDTYVKAKISYDFAADRVLSLMTASPQTTEDAALLAIREAEKALLDFINLATLFGMGGTK